MIPRAAVLVALLLGAWLFGTRATGAEAAVERESLGTLPYELGPWRGRDARPLTGDVVALLGVDDHIHRSYVGEAGVPMGLYAGYYASQRQGDTIHSPQNCLPGSGWRPVESSIATLPVAGRPLEVNRYIIQKGLDRQVVLYWYQGRGRVVANEFANKAFLMWDAARLRRSNGGLVRIVTPMSPNHDAAAEAMAFAAALVPKLDRLMP